MVGAVDSAISVCRTRDAIMVTASISLIVSATRAGAECSVTRVSLYYIYPLAVAVWCDGRWGNE